MSERTLEEGDIHDVLRNERRRHTLEQLRDDGGSLSVRELSEQVATLETGESPPPRNIRQSVYVSLHQTHLPKLDGLGIIEYDADAKRVTLMDRAQEVETYTNLSAESGSGPGFEPDSDRRWARYSLVLSVLGLFAMVAVALDVPAFVTVGAPAIAAVLFVLVFALAVGRLRSDGGDSDPDRS